MLTRLLLLPEGITEVGPVLSGKLLVHVGAFCSCEAACYLSLVPRQLSDLLLLDVILKVHGLQYTAANIFILHYGEISIYQVNCAVHVSALGAEISEDKDAIFLQDTANTLEEGLEVPIAVRALNVHDHIG